MQSYLKTQVIYTYTFLLNGDAACESNPDGHNVWSVMTNAIIQCKNSLEKGNG